jgi:hypothetical protein
MPFVSDTMTDTNGTALASHVGESGATWSVHQSATGTATIQGNRLRYGINSQVGRWYASGVPATAEYDVEADFYCANATNANAGIIGRVNTGADTYYYARYLATEGWRLYRFVAGTPTLLDSVSASLTNGVTYHVKLEIRDATKRLYVDGVLTLTSTDNTITAAGRAGIRFTADATRNGMEIDNFVATDVGGGGSGNPWYYYAQQRLAI